MAQGRNHRRFNIIILFLLGLGMLIFGLPVSFLLLFLLGYLFSTLVFTPDSDLLPSKFAGPFRLFFYPYSMIFKHRGVSHGFFLGTLTRVWYVLSVGGLCIYILHEMGHIPLSLRAYGEFLWQSAQSYDSRRLPYQLITWFMLGMFFGDFFHVTLDHLSTGMKRLWSGR